MPLYACKCKKCGKRDDVFLPLAKYKDLPFCCDQQMTKVFTPPHVIEDLKPYKSPLDGSIINSRSDHKKHMRNHGVIEVGNETLDRPMNKTVETDPTEELKKVWDQLDK